MAVTAFGNNSNDSKESYLFYENRSRIDGLTGLFGKIKRGVIEDQAVDSLTAILEKSKASLTARMIEKPETITAFSATTDWKRWTTGVIRGGLLVFLISAFITLLVLGKHDLRSVKPSTGLSKRKQIKSYRPPVM